jgi:hypothetical protein
VIHSKPTIQPDQGQNPKNNVKNKINSFIEKPKHRSDSEERKNRLKIKSILLLKKQNIDQIRKNEKIEEIGKRKALPCVLRSQNVNLLYFHKIVSYRPQEIRHYLEE